MRLFAPLLLLSLGAACQSVPDAGSIASYDGAPIVYERTGSGEPALVFIHGWSCHRGHWEHQVPAFAGAHTVVTLDLAGHGESGLDREDWSIPALGKDVAAVVEALDLDDVILVGHSMGGQVSLEAAQLLPGRVRGIVGADTLHSASPPLSPEMFEPVLAAYEADFQATARQFTQMMFVGDPDPELVERISSDLSGTHERPAIELFRNFPHYDIGEAMGRTEVPVRCINAAYMPTDGEGNRAAGVDFDHVAMDGVGHFLMLEQPEAFNAHLAAFVAELSAR